MLYGFYEYNENDEPIIESAEIKLICQFLKKDKSVIIDECWTTINPEARKNLINRIKSICPNVDVTAVNFVATKNNVERRMTNPRGYEKQKWTEVYQQMMEKWIPANYKEYDYKNVWEVNISNE